MSYIILYHATDPEAIDQCAYSLLKYLSVYNLKPPADHVVQIHTSNPAALEMYGSLFSHFHLVESGDEFDPAQISRLAPAKSPLLYIGASAYPAKPFEPVLKAIDGGKVYLEKSNRQAGEEQIQVLGLKNRESTGLPPRGQDPSPYIISYEPIPEFSRFLREFFQKYQEESVPNQVKLMQGVDARTIAEDKKQFSRLPFHTRMLKKIRGKAWSMRSYTSRI